MVMLVASSMSSKNVGSGMTITSRIKTTLLAIITSPPIILNGLGTEVLFVAALDKFVAR